jgi:hypothetical protein
MSEELKPCPFCGGTKICTEKGINLNYCDNCSAESNIEHWNTRPIEDDLRKRIAELEALVNVSEGLYERIYEQAARIAELENEHNVWLIGASNAVKNLEARIAELEAERRWIPVSERLPEDTERMLTIVYDAFEDTTAISILQHYGDGDWFSWDSGRYVVTHWMPLPESPNDTQTQTFVYGKESD